MSNNLDLSQIASNQLNKHITANDQVGELDAAITELQAVPVDDSNAVTLTAAAFLSTGGELNARVTTAVGEVLSSGGVPHARVTGLVAEVLHGLEALTAGGAGRKPIVVVVAG